ncbi:MAG: GAF domain-containing sensor histidine kinase, partial [Bacteroidota bacterium]
MSNALPVLVVPDADDTTRRVLSALRAAALAEAPTPAEEPPSDYLLRWDRPTALRLEPSATPVRGADGRVLFVEGTLSASEASTDAETPASSLMAPQGVVQATTTPETPAKGASESDLVAALLAFAEAASRARTPEEACTAAVVAAEQVLGTRRVAIMRKEPSGALLLGAASQAFEAPLYAQLANPAVWSDTDVPSLTTALPDIEDTSAAWLPDAMRPFLDHPRHRAALLLPLLHRDHAVGLLWAFYEAPQVFDLSMRQRGGVLAHHLSATLAAAAASTWGQSMETYPVVKVSPTKTNPADEPPAADEPSQPELPLKALVGLATVAAFGMEQAEDGAWNVVWATKSFRKLIDVGPKRALSLSDVLAAVHPSDARGVLAAINEVAVGAPVRFDHRLVTPDGQTRWVRQAITRRDEEGADELLVVLLDIDPDRAALRRAEEALEEARRRASTSVLGPLSESLRVPITTILDRAQVLGQSGPVRDNERHHLAREIAEQGRGLLASLNLMVDLARIEAGDVDLVRSDLDVHEAVGRVFDVLGPLASRKGLTIEAHKGGARCIVHQDPHALSRVLHHVVSTAITQAPPGTLRLRTDEVEGTVRLSLRSEAMPAREHEPGRTSPLTSPLSGLIAERLLALMGGRLYTEATATAPFYVRLELPSVHRGAPAAASSEAPVETPAETQAAEPLPTVRPADRALPGDDRVAAASTNTKDGKELRSQVTAAAGEDATAAVVAMDNAGEEIAA